MHVNVVSKVNILSAVFKNFTKLLHQNQSLLKTWTISDALGLAHTHADVKKVNTNHKRIGPLIVLIVCLLCVPVGV